MTQAQGQGGGGGADHLDQNSSEDRMSSNSGSDLEGMGREGQWDMDEYGQMEGSMEQDDENDLGHQLKDQVAEEEVLDQIVAGAARDKMIEIANKIAETTPAIIDRESRKKLLILEQVRKQGEDKGMKRVLKMIKEETAEMQATQKAFLMENKKQVPGGLTLDKGKLPMGQQEEVYDECGVDYQSKYEDENAKFEFEVGETQYLRQMMLTKQEDHIFREQEYRTTIKILEKQIDEISLHPLRQVEKPSEDQKTLALIKSRLNLNDSDSGDQSDSDGSEAGERKNQKKLKNQEEQKDQNQGKSVKEINQDLPLLEEKIAHFQQRTQEEMRNRRTQKWKEYDEKIKQLRSELQAAKQDQMDNKTDFKENEKKLQEKLEIMTSNAEKIDIDNRELIKKNNELRIQYYAQTGDKNKSIKGDREILLKQILQAKKKGADMADKHSALKLQVEQLEKDKAQTDAMLSQNQYAQGGRSTAKGKPAMHSNFSAMSKESSSKMLFMRQQANNNRTGTAPKAGQFDRPHTAAMLFPVAGAARPYTGNQAGYFNQTRVNGIPGQTSGLQGLQKTGRAVSAGFVKNPKLARYEDLIARLKKLLEQEKKNLRVVRTMCASEIDNRNQLERILRQCVTDVQEEIARKRSQNTSGYYAKGRRGQSELQEERNLSRMEREKIIEVLLSQERVLTLLYDKTFPPNPSNQNKGLAGSLGAALKPSGSTYGMGQGGNSMLQFNYHGQPQNEQPQYQAEEYEDEGDLVALEREVEEAVRCGTASAPRRGQNRDPNSGMHATGFRSSQNRQQMASTAVGGKRTRLPPQPVRKRLQSTNYSRPTGGIGGPRQHIY